MNSQRTVRKRRALRNGDRKTPLRSASARACSNNLACARELLAATTSPLIAVPVVAREDVAEASPAENTRPCPCCGAPMVIIETFERAHRPRAPPSSMREAA